ncbi:MAG: MFS transporter [Gammaproteobacteria bacterium]|nr:MFS transporter [Gammaproteobacteria bacterium]
MSQVNLLHSRRFLPLFLTQFLGAFNDNVFKNALVIFIAFTVAERAGTNSSILVILAGGVFILPFFLFSATAGQLADRYEKSMLIRHIKTAEIIIMIAAVFGFLQESVAALMVILFFMGAQSTFFGPLKYGILPQHLAPEELTGGNGLIQMGTYLAILTGTILGGILVAAEDRGPAAVGAMLVVIAIAGRVASRFIPVAEPCDRQLKIDVNILRQTTRIMGFAWESGTVFAAIIAISWFWFAGATFLSLVPTFARDFIHGNETIATALLTAFSVGIGVGSVLCERFSGKRIEPGLVPIGAAGLSLFAFDLHFVELLDAGSAAVLGMGEFMAQPRHWRVLADFSLIGFFGGIYIVPLYALVQHRCDPARRARIIAANNVLNALFMVVSAGLVIALVAWGFTPQDIFLLIAVMTLIVTGLIFARNPEYLARGKMLLGGFFRRRAA